MKINPAGIHISEKVKFRLMTIGGLFMHCIFFAYFLLNGIYIMAVFNIFSITVYSTGTVVTLRPGFKKLDVGWLTLLFAEILIHAILASLVVGWESGFNLYAIAVVPVSSYSLFASCEIKRFWKIITTYIILVLASMLAVYLYLDHYGTLFSQLGYTDIDPGRESLMRLCNHGLISIMIILFTFLFIYEIHRHIQELNSINEKLNYIATHDALTGLYNRHSLTPFYDDLEKNDENFCVILGDIDDFKQVNDTYGHDCGDKVLKSIADLIKSKIGEGDIACRWGGEEILVIMRGSRDDCFGRIQSIKAGINALTIRHNHTIVKVSMTFGFADCSESAGARVRSLIPIADKRLYKGKASGKNTIIA